MTMEKLQKYFLTVGLFFVIGGVLAGVGGALKMLRFFGEAGDLRQVTVVQLTWGVIIPHIFMLIGMGILIYGVILLVKGTTFRRTVSPGTRERQSGRHAAPRAADLDGS